MGLKSKNRFELVTKLHAVVGFAARGRQFLFDSEDLNKVAKYTWRVDPTRGYVRAYNEKGVNMNLHRFVMGATRMKSKVVDHINHNKVDCRKENLRIVSQRHNTHNLSLRKNNKCGYPGITFIKNKYIAIITAGSKKIYLGAFDTVEKAIEKRKKAEKIYRKGAVKC